MQLTQQTYFWVLGVLGVIMVIFFYKWYFRPDVCAKREERKRRKRLAKEIESALNSTDSNLKDAVYAFARRKGLSCDTFEFIAGGKFEVEKALEVRLGGIDFLFIRKKGVWEEFWDVPLDEKTFSLQSA